MHLLRWISNSRTQVRSKYRRISSAYARRVPTVLFTLTAIALSTQPAQAREVFDGSTESLSSQNLELSHAFDLRPAVPLENAHTFEVTLEREVPITFTDHAAATVPAIRSIKQDLSALYGYEQYGPFELSIVQDQMARADDKDIIDDGQSESKKLSQKITVKLAGAVDINNARSPATAKPVCKPDTMPFASDPFDSNLTVGVQLRELTKEDANRWVRASSPGYWPTLEYRAYQNCIEDPSAKLVSQAGIHLLARVAGMRVQPSMGLVIAKAAAGWNAQLSGRAERPIVFAIKPTGRVSLKPEELLVNDGFERFYVFLNVAPGAHLLHFQQLTRVGSGQTGAIGIPVVESHLTFVNATDARVVKFNGRVVRGEYRTVEPVAQATLRPWGASENATTQKDGGFQFSSIATFGNYPTQLDVDFRDGYTHRFQIMVQDAQKAKDPTLLFVFGRARVRAWVEQLSGGLSPLTGMVIGAAPALVTKNTQDKGDPIYPSISTLEGDSLVKPEMYTLGLRDHLQVQTSLTINSPRYAGFSLPEGIHLIELLTGSKVIQASRMVFSSPGVIEVLAPR